MQTVYVFLANGFEEVEALFPIDILRRAGVPVVTVGVTGKTVVSAHSVPVAADVDGEGFTLPEDAAMVFLPGGGEGTDNLLVSELVQDSLQRAAERGLYIAAICAAPKVLHKYGLLQGRRATAFPTVQGQLAGANVTGAAVEQDGNIITGRSAGVAMQFAQSLATALVGQAAARQVVDSLYP